MKNKLNKKEFYSIDIANSNLNEYSKMPKAIKKHVSVHKFQSNRVVPENFYKPISKYLKF